MDTYNYKPWIEKYRPETFEDIILDKHNKVILKNMVFQNSLSNILFYGPPGTGKTTTIMNLIRLYQTHTNETGEDLIIHLNASDERGIDVIRNQIQAFVCSKTLFNKGKKFVILDEIDYMTKSAQQALKTIIMECTEDVCFCLICNYISRIEKSLQDIFIHFHFNSLSQKHILSFLQGVIYSEGLDITTHKLCKIIKFFGSDIRSMINYLQINQHNLQDVSIIDDTIYENIVKNINNKSIKHTINKINTLSYKHNVSKKEILKNICRILQNIIVTNKTHINKNIFEVIKYVLHDKENEIDYLMYYLVSKLNGSLLSCSSK
jgi:replication factor C subunit 3/5